MDKLKTESIKVIADTSGALASAINELVAQAEKKQRESPGTQYVWALLLNLVAAKLALTLPHTQVKRTDFTINAFSIRVGEFQLGNSVIYVTLTPTQSLMEKCRDNISQGQRPIIVTRQRGVPSAGYLAEDMGIGDQIDVYDLNQFLSLKLYELSSFDTRNQFEVMRRFIDIYNRIVDERRADPSLRIEIQRV